jgi:hypothetical protein
MNAQPYHLIVRAWARNLQNTKVQGPSAILRLIRLSPGYPEFLVKRYDGSRTIKVGVEGSGVVTKADKV